MKKQNTQGHNTVAVIKSTCPLATATLLISSLILILSQSFSPSQLKSQINHS